ncbi:transcriptional activator of glycolytic enzymes-domain-containing protein [Xylaria intraflava]|nr:transcriptional activator of glycolytic enzymes-domain-containing protein [Xylaria intraflava]
MSPAKTKNACRSRSGNCPSGSKSRSFPGPSAGPAVGSGASALLDRDPPVYRMCRFASTVEELWHEWMVGLPGHPSVDFLDKMWGSRWRSGCRREIQWYSLRLEIIREIRHIAQAQRRSEDEAVQVLQQRQDQQLCSLAALCKRLRAERKQRFNMGSAGGAGACNVSMSIAVRTRTG